MAYRGIPLQSAYCGAKHAIQVLNEALRCELLHEKSNVHVTMAQMPAVNTPQFAALSSPPPGRRSRCRRSISQSLPLAVSSLPPTTRGGVNIGVGVSTMATLAANAVAPGVLDRDLAKTGFSSQQASEPQRPDAPANLWDPADGQGGRDYGAHGIFDGKSHDRDPQLWSSDHHKAMGIGITSLLGARPSVQAPTMNAKRVFGIGQGALE